MTELVLCKACGVDASLHHFLCDEEPGSWCPNCFQLTGCGRGEHGEGCPTAVFGEGRGSTGEGVSAAALDVLAERRRQVEVEGWTAEHDDRHNDGEIARAASAYALAGGRTARFSALNASFTNVIKMLWPWAPERWKPSPDRRRDLVKAGALILAEIERLDRAEQARS